MNCKSSLYILVIVAIVIIVYNSILHLFSKNISNIDFMNKKVINMNIFNESCCSMWPISHFILFMVLGIFFPNCQILLILLGVIWEILEFLISLQYKKPRVNNNIEYPIWWSGSFKDIIFNIAGLYTGVLIGYILRKYGVLKHV